MARAMFMVRVMVTVNTRARIWFRVTVNARARARLGL